jgi:nitrate reductase NapD
MSDGVNIAGVLVHARIDELDSVRDDLAGLPGVELHQTIDGGRLIVTVEDVQDHSAADTILAVHRIPGVIAAALVYHHFEPDAPSA